MMARLVGVVLALSVVMVPSWVADAAPDRGTLVRKNVTVLPVRLIPFEARGAIRDVAPPAAAAVQAVNDEPLRATVDGHGATIRSAMTIDDISVDIQEAITAAYEAQPEFATVPWSEVLKGLESDPNLKQGMSLARAGVELGTNQYRNLNVSEALASLKRAAGVLHEHLGGIRNPDLAAGLYLHLGLSHLEQGQMNEAFAALRSMYHYTPMRSFQSGFYPVRMEDAISRAYMDFVRSPMVAFPEPSKKHLHRLREIAKLDHAVVLVHRADFPNRVEVRVVDLRRKVSLQETMLPLTDEGVPDADALDQMVSRFVACEVFERRYVNPRDQRAKATFVSAQFGYHTYFKYPTRSLFHNMATGVEVDHGLSRYLALYGGATLLSSVEDRNRNLNHQLVSARLTAGTQLRLLFRRVTLFFAPGVELNIHPGYTVLTSVDCKYFGADHPQCDPKNLKSKDGQYLTGLTTTLGARFHINKDAFLGVQMLGGFYLLPLNRSDDLDLPFTANAVLGFRL